ncbi:MAG: cysteine desulfurase [Coraliomargaritaceae bacterium]
MFNVQSIRDDFPILSTLMNDKPLIYLDNAATSQKPLSVIAAVEEFYKTGNSNIHRGVFRLSEQATSQYEATRGLFAEFISAEKETEIVFVKGVTEAINLISYGFAQSILDEGDEILISEMEHHANIVPWQIACKQTGAVLKIIPVLDDGSLDLLTFESLLSEKTKLLSIVHISNSLGTINPIKSMINKAHAMGVPVLVDGAQSAPHMKVNVKDLDCDFYVFSGHKLFAPTGVGVLYGKEKWLEKLPPYQSGGDMIEKVDFGGTTFKGIPGKFEAGTPNISGVIGLSKAIEYLQKLDREKAMAHEDALLKQATEGLNEIDGLRLIGTAEAKASIVSFVFENIHAHDVGTFLDAGGIAIRTGHHCTMPLLKRFDVPATARASFAFYNNSNDVDCLVESLKKMKSFFYE